MHDYKVKPPHFTSFRIDDICYLCQRLLAVDISVQALTNDGGDSFIVKLECCEICRELT